MKHIYLRAASRAGVDGSGFHNLRHTCASLLIAIGAPITIVSGISGHESSKMTLDVYGHFYKEDSVYWINQVANFFQKLIGTK